jgi:hypothetical protein
MAGIGPLCAAAACAALVFTIGIGVTSVCGARDLSANETDLPSDQ